LNRFTLSDPESGLMGDKLQCVNTWLMSDVLPLTWEIHTWPGRLDECVLAKLPAVRQHDLTGVGNNSKPSFSLESLRRKHGDDEEQQ